MLTPSVIQKATQSDLYDFVAEQCLPRLREELRTGGAARRLRVVDLPTPVMDRLAAQLDRDGAGGKWVARILVEERAVSPWQATATKLIEYRNILVEPLLVFLPTGLRIAAEDSLDIATFTEIPIAPKTRLFASELGKRLPHELWLRISDALEYLRKEKVIQSPDAEVDYLLTVIKNGGSAAAAGGALFVFGLIPDFSTFLGTEHRHRLSRNQKMSGMLADVKIPLQERIARLRLEQGSIQKDLFRFLRDRHADETASWTREIACESQFRPLALENWPFVDSLEGKERLRLILAPLDLPMQTEDEVGGATAMKVWDLQKQKTFRVSFSSVPAPALFESWKNFRIQLLETNEGEASPVWTSNNFPKPKTRAKTRLFSRQLKASDFESVPEGSYYLRIDALSQDGTVLTESETVANSAETSSSSRAENESERFLIMRGEVVVPDDEPRAARTTCFSEAWSILQGKKFSGHDEETVPARSELTGHWDQPAHAAIHGDVSFTFDNPAAHALAVTLPGILRKLEYEALEHPQALGLFRLDLDDVHALSDVVVKRRAVSVLPTDTVLVAFVKARTAVFDAILAQHVKRTGGEDREKRRQSTVETADLIALRPLIESYARAFLDLTRFALSADEAAALRRLISRMDVTEVRWRPTGGDPGRALVVGPVHPLRLLWHLQHSVLIDSAWTARRDKTEKVPSWKSFFEQLHCGLLPANLPMVLFDEQGRRFVEREHLTSHWALYLPDRAPLGHHLDLGACRANARRQLGITRRYIAHSGLSADDLATRAVEYLAQHPYVEQLRINVFNPGDGQLIADMLRRIEAARFAIVEAQPPSLRYAVQMFTSADHVDEAGEALDALLDPERQVGDKDEFSLASSNHLLPKLLIARSTIAEFLKEPQAFGSHIAVFAEHFRAEARLGNVGEFRRGVFVAGLIAEPSTQQDVRTGGIGYGWSKGIHPKGARNPDAIEALLIAALDGVQRVQASSAEGTLTPDGTAPTLSLRLELVDQALLRQVHDTSDWVLTIERNLGLDYFDSSTTSDETGYLLDFSPEFLREDQPRILLTTRSTAELHNLIRPTLEAFDLKLPPGAELMVLETLRSLSGRFALRALSGPNQAAEVIGLLVARWALEGVGLLRRQIVIPIDAHRSWFRAEDRDPLSAITYRRADLLLINLRPEDRTLDIHVVEVKQREEVSAHLRSQFYEGMHEQAESTVNRLRDLFDQELYPVPRADRLLRAKELANVLSFYVARALRYGLIEPEVAKESAAFIESLDESYRLEFRSLGVLFEQRASGFHVDEDEPGFPVHRIGGDVAERLLEEAAAAFQRSRAAGSTDDQALRPQTPPLSSQLSQELSPLRSQLGCADQPKSFVPEASRIGSLLVSTDSAGAEAPLPSAAPASLPESPSPVTGASTPLSVTVDVASPVPPGEIAVVRSLSAESEPVLQGKIQPSVPADLTAVNPLVNVAVLGATERSQQLGILGKSGNAKVAVDLNGCNTISLFGVQGFGKSYTMGVIAEMAVQPMAGINVLPAPLATVIFHYHKSDAYEPEFASAVQPNPKAREVDRLLAEYGARPDGLRDMVLLVPQAKVEQRRSEYPGILVQPIHFASSELGADGWKFLMGAVGNDSLYVKQIVSIMQRSRGKLTLEKLKSELADADLSKGLRKLAETRISLAETYINDTARLGSVLRPGRTVIVDLRDEWLEQDDALGLFVVMMTIFGAAKHEGKPFNKLMVFDEAHKYITESELIGQVVGIIREMRHQATSVLIASQDPLSVPRAVIELTSLLILHRMTSPQWLKHLKGAIGALEGLSEAQVGSLAAGESLVWAQRSTELRFTQRPQKVTIRPRVTQHGGGTKTAVAGATAR